MKAMAIKFDTVNEPVYFETRAETKDGIKRALIKSYPEFLNVEEYAVYTRTAGRWIPVVYVSDKQHNVIQDAWTIERVVLKSILNDNTMYSYYMCVQFENIADHVEHRFTTNPQNVYIDATTSELRKIVLDGAEDFYQSAQGGTYLITNWDIAEQLMPPSSFKQWQKFQRSDWRGRNLMEWQAGTAKVAFYRLNRIIMAARSAVVRGYNA